MCAHNRAVQTPAQPRLIARPRLAARLQSSSLSSRTSMSMRSFFTASIAAASKSSEARHVSRSREGK